MLSLQSVLKARQSVGEVAIRTSLMPSTSLSTETRAVRLKLETLQPTGSFKIRGATNAIANLTAEGAKRGVVCASTGNHGRALTYAAKARGVRTTVCMSELVPENKVAAIRDLGAEVRIVGQSQDDAQLEVNRLVAEEGMIEIPPFDHQDVITGQGTIGLEIVEDWPEVDTVLVPLSGGGLIAGIALAIKSVCFDIKVIGVSMQRGAAMKESLQRGYPVEVTEEPSLADSLGGGIGLKNQFTFDIAQELIDDVILLDEGQIADGMRHLYRKEGIVAEGAAAVGVSVLLGELSEQLGENVAVVVSGRNVDMPLFEEVMKGALPFGK
ncbi:hydroxyectoine utilization dehydratase EutB [Sneathiella limimaris]|uniref:hydroxyectoine utilization dehydratase EutB n=1 Tax=Sneathiella limimaris TaxID=1964213 RepID=UPI00146D4F30|nr:hydroxyectoine utilization dehydratase EutB [Sneathiella limimaris]